MIGLLATKTQGLSRLGWRNWLKPAPNPVGLDLGSHWIRAAQVQFVNGEPELTGAAACEVPDEARENPAAYCSFVSGALRGLWRDGGFQGRKVVLGLPTAFLHLVHLRLPKLEGEALTQTMSLEAAGKLPIDPVTAVLRHHIVGEVHTPEGPRLEVLCTAASRELVESLIAAAERAKLEAVGLVAAPMAVRDCFAHVFRRREDRESAFCFIDIGLQTTRVVIERGGHIYFARSVQVGATDFDAAVASAAGINAEEARLLRLRTVEDEAASAEPGTASTPAPAAAPAAVAPDRRQASAPGFNDAMPGADGDDSGTDHSFALLGAAMRAGAMAEQPPEEDQVSFSDPSDPASAAAIDAPQNAPAALPGPSAALQVAAAVAPLLDRLADEVRRCKRYHEATFPAVPVKRLVFVGGEANQRSLCQELARRLNLAAQVGDPMTRIGFAAGRGPLDFLGAGLDRRRPQPAWVAACGLALGQAQ